MSARQHHISSPGTLKGLVVVFPGLASGDTISSVAESADTGLTVSATVGAASVTHKGTTYTAGQYLEIDIVAASGMAAGNYRWNLAITTTDSEILTYGKTIIVSPAIEIGD